MKFKFLLNIVFILFSSFIFSQTFHWDSTEHKAVRLQNHKTDSVLKGNRHMIGIGTQFIPGHNKSRGHIESLLEYNFPQLNIFYRYQLLMLRRIHAFNFVGTEWYLHNIETTGSNASSSSVDIKKTVLAIEIGYTHFWRFSKSKNSCLGISGNAMFQYGFGTRDAREGIFYNGTGTYVTYNTTDYFEKLELWPAFNIEFNQRIPLKNKSLIMLGIKSSIISRTVLYLGYNFRR